MSEHYINNSTGDFSLCFSEHLTGHPNKQLKQNFPLHFFYGDSVNAIQIQTWVVLIANLLITILSRSIKRNCAFSQVVTMVRLTLMYYIDFITFMENPDKTWEDILAKEQQKAPPEPTLFD